MLTAIKQRLDREEEGFTLIELMVVVLIIAILLAIAIPTFLSARDSANARSAQSDLNTAVTDEQSFWTNNQSWGVSADMTTADANIKWSDGGASATVTPGNNVMITTGSADGGVILTAAGNDNKCYSEEVINGQVSGQQAPGTYFDVTTPATAKTCSAPAAVSTPSATDGAVKAGGWSSVGW